MPHVLSNDGGHVAVKRAAEDREVWKHSEMTSETCTTEILLLNLFTDQNLTL